jgi:hypothetical protein
MVDDGVGSGTGTGMGNILNQQMWADSPTPGTGNLFEDMNTLPELFLTNEYSGEEEVCNGDFFDLLRFPT